MWPANAHQLRIILPVRVLRPSFVHTEVPLKEEKDFCCLNQGSRCLFMFHLRRLPILLSLASSATLAHAASNTPNKTAFVASGAGLARNLSESITAKSTSTLSGVSSSDHSPTNKMTFDKEYPGTAVERMMAVRDRVGQLSTEDLSGPWEDVRRKLLWAGGLRDLTGAVPGQGYTGHAFNDYNHVDLTCMAEKVSYNLNDGSVREIAVGNLLGPGIRIASLPELGPGGSWSTCANGSNRDPPQDVAHIQFRSRIAFKLVWVPNANFDAFVLVDDDGKELARGNPTGQLPSLRQRQMNFAIVKGGKYAKVAESIASDGTVTECSSDPSSSEL